MAKNSFQSARHGSRIRFGLGADHGEPAIHSNVDKKLLEMNQFSANEDSHRHQTLPKALYRAEVNG